MTQAQVDMILEGRDLAFHDVEGHVYITGYPAVVTALGSNVPLLVVTKRLPGREPQALVIPASELLSEHFEPSFYSRSGAAL